MPPPQPPKAQEDEDDLHSGHEAANRSNVKTNKDDENLESVISKDFEGLELKEQEISEAKFYFAEIPLSAPNPALFCSTTLFNFAWHPFGSFSS